MGRWLGSSASRTPAVRGVVFRVALCRLTVTPPSLGPPDYGPVCWLPLKGRGTAGAVSPTAAEEKGETGERGGPLGRLSDRAAPPPPPRTALPPLLQLLPSTHSLLPHHYACITRPALIRSCRCHWTDAERPSRCSWDCRCERVSGDALTASLCSPSSLRSPPAQWKIDSAVLDTASSQHRTVAPSD